MSRMGRVAAIVILLCVGCGPPQIGDDGAAFKSVDALYTAVSLRDATLLDRCRQDLRSLKASGKLPEAAHAKLEAIMTEAAGGAWEPAQSRLADFMRGQHR